MADKTNPSHADLAARIAVLDERSKATKSQVEANTIATQEVKQALDQISGGLKVARWIGAGLLTIIGVIAGWIGRGNG